MTEKPFDYDEIGSRTAFKVYVTGALILSGWEYAETLLWVMAGLVLLNVIVQRYKHD